MVLGVLVALGPAGPAGSGVLAPGGRDGARMGVPSLHAAKMAPIRILNKINTKIFWMGILHL